MADPEPSDRERVLLVEDDAGTRHWLASLIAREPGLEVAAQCGSVAQALAWLAEHEADFALVDLGLPDGSGLDVIRRLAAEHPRCEVLVLSIFGDENNVLAAIAHGAGGYLLKDGDLGRLGDHLACLRTGGSPLSPKIARTLIQRYRAPADLSPSATTTSAHSRRRVSSAPLTSAGAMPVMRRSIGGDASGTTVATPVAPLPQLSQRELDVLTGVAKGFSYDEVAGLLGITTNTVRTHIRNLYGKLSVNSRGEAVYEYNRLMREHGLSPIE